LFKDSASASRRLFLFGRSFLYLRNRAAVCLAVEVEGYVPFSSGN
jgi:hypothetical protein